MDGAVWRGFGGGVELSDDSPVLPWRCLGVGRGDKGVPLGTLVIGDRVGNLSGEVRDGLRRALIGAELVSLLLEGFGLSRKGGGV